jgi:hypothetical protein
LPTSHRRGSCQYCGLRAFFSERVITSHDKEHKIADFHRYILEEEYQAERPFIWRENAHLDISFSCIAFLNSCVSLLPANSTEAQRAGIIVGGFHGLQIYADMFWYRHLLAYCGLLVQQKRQLSTELLTQLQLLLRFWKEDSRATVPKSKTTTEKDGTEDPTLEALNHLPDVKRLVSDVLVFRTKMTREDASDKSPESKLPSPAKFSRQT